MYSQRKLNHDMICPLLRKLATFKSDIHSKSIMKLLINSFALRKSEEEFLKENNDNNKWLSLVPLPSDIEEYEKEIREEELRIKNSKIENIIDNNDDIEKEESKEGDNNIDDDESILEKNDDISSDESEIKKMKKDKIKKKHKKKDKDEKDGKKHRHKKDKDENDDKKHKHKKDKKQKKEENDSDLDDEKMKNESKKTKSKNKNSKHQNEEKDIENNENLNKNISDEQDENNTDKYDIVTNTIPYSGTYSDMMHLQSHFEEWTDGIVLNFIIYYYLIKILKYIYIYIYLKI